jgi:hypothetical protein
MTVESIISTFTRYSSWLYNRNWERWEIVTIAIIALAVVFYIIAARRKARIQTRHTHQYRPVIGIKLAHRGDTAPK